MNIIFVCTGNTCRSPLAESLAQAAIPVHHFESRGLAAFPGAPVSTYSAELIEQHHLPAVGPATPFSDEDVEADLILTMSQQHKDSIRSLYPLANVYTLAEYASGSPADIVDPYGGHFAHYEQVFTELRAHIDNLAKKLPPV